jgi:D-lyxose ketol-isomerase
VHLFVPGHKLDSGEKEFALRLVPADKHATLTMFKHIHLTPGSQYTLPPNTLHWFVAGPQGAVISAFSTRSRDEADIFTDPDIRRFE